MQRHPRLQPLSREHYSALKLAKLCAQAADGDDTAIGLACQRAIQFHAEALQPHFLLEENSLFPLLRDTPHQPLVEHALLDHRELARLKERMLPADKEVLRQFGQLLKEHVRFEERDLFPALETRLDQAE